MAIITHCCLTNLVKNGGHLRPLTEHFLASVKVGVALLTPSVVPSVKGWRGDLGEVDEGNGTLRSGQVLLPPARVRTDRVMRILLMDVEDGAILELVPEGVPDFL